MIDWSDLGRKRNGLFAAACYRKRGLPLLTWATARDELTPSQNRLEEAFIARLLRNLPDAIRPLLLADRGFGRASLLRWLQEMPRHTGRTCVPVTMCFCPERRWGGNGELGAVLGSGASGTLVSGDIAARRQGGGAALSPADAAGAVLSRWQAVFCVGGGNSNHYGAAGAYAGGLLLACCLLLLVARRRRGGSSGGVCSWGSCGWGWSTIWLRRSPRPYGSACPTPESGYARVTITA